MIIASIILEAVLAIAALAFFIDGEKKGRTIARLQAEKESLRQDALSLQGLFANMKHYSASYTVTESDYLDKKRTVPMVAKARISKQLAMEIARDFTLKSKDKDGKEVYYIDVYVRTRGGDAAKIEK